jgi:hypothetical protein
LRTRPGAGAALLNVALAVFVLAAVGDTARFIAAGPSVRWLAEAYLLSGIAALFLLLVAQRGWRLRRELRRLGYPPVGLRTAAAIVSGYSERVLGAIPPWEMVACSPLVRPDDPDTTLYALLDALRDAREAAADLASR